MAPVIYYFLLILLCICPETSLYGRRSVQRPVDTHVPQITTYWDKQSPHYTIKDSRLQEYPIFTITAEDSYPYSLPNTPISFSTNPSKKVMGTALKKDLEHLLQEIYAGNTSFTRFEILSKLDFNFHKEKLCGFIVLKHKWYPFVVKLSIERPETFVNPFCKGLVPICFFFMAGGSNRYMTGLTRIINAHNIQKTIATHPTWQNLVHIPRKWFWMPENPTFFHVVGKNIGKSKQEITTTLPSIYAIIADAIDITHQTSLSTHTKNGLIIRLCNDLNLMIDPHENNFIFQINPITKQLSIIIIDTEHFPTMVGIKQKQHFTSHIDFYLSLAKKCTHDIFFCSKYERRQLQWAHEKPYSQLQLL